MLFKLFITSCQKANTRGPSRAGSRVRQREAEWRGAVVAQPQLHHKVNVSFLFPNKFTKNKTNHTITLSNSTSLSHLHPYLCPLPVLSVIYLLTSQRTCLTSGASTERTWIQGTRSIRLSRIDRTVIIDWWLIVLYEDDGKRQSVWECVYSPGRDKLW